MKELWQSILNAYGNYRGTGKLFGLFLVAVLIIYLMNNSNDAEETGIKRRINPGLFLLFIWGGIAYGFSMILGMLKSKRIKPVYSVIVCGLMVLTIIMSGKRVFCEEFYSKADNGMHIKAEYVEVMDSILDNNDDYIRIVAAPNMAPYFSMYSSKLTTLYTYPDNNDLSLLDKDERYIYEQMACSTPDEKKLVEKMRELDCNYIVYNSTKNYFELPLEGFGYELTDSVGDYRVYRDLGGVE